MVSFRKNSGFGILEGLIAGTVILIGIFANLSTLTSYLSELKKESYKQSITTMKSKITQLAQSSDDVSRMANAQGFSCLMSRSNCLPGTENFTAINLSDASGAVLTSGAANFGFNDSVLPCNDFPSRGCPFRYEVQWRAICVPGSVGCVSPLFQFQGRLFIFQDLKEKINSENFGFIINLGQIIGTYEQSCTSIGGTYVSGNPPQCQFPLVGPCPNDATGGPQVMYGYNRATNTKLCRPVMWPVSCPAPNTYMAGIDANGIAVCRQQWFTCCDGTTQRNPALCPVAGGGVCPLPCQKDPTLPECASGSTLPPVGGPPPTDGGFGPDGGPDCGGDSGNGPGDCSAN
jgi:hypothetical protein